MNDAHRAADNARKRAARTAGREIGDIPPVADSERKERAIRDWQFAFKQYFPQKFSLPWSEDHLYTINRLEAACYAGGLFAIAMPRGSGKTTLCEAAAIMAVLTGRQPFVMLIGASKGLAKGMMDNLKAELSHNPLLLADFPEVCYPIHCLNGESRRARGQLHHGAPTLVDWSERQIILPTIPGSRAAGAIVRAAGLTGAIRGANFRRPSGEQIRPTLAIIDDPQTDKSAKSPNQCASREALISGGVLGLAGPGQKIAAVMPCTVIQRGDLADRLLDRTKNPEWQGHRTQLIRAWPDRADLWDEYARLRADELRAGGTGEKATAFYRDHRAEMDVGGIPSWPDRFNPDELSAIQHAVNLKLRDPVAFASEYQNAPEEAHGGEAQLDGEHLARKSTGLTRGQVPPATQYLTAFIDIQQRLLYWIVCAWQSDLSGAVIDYGTWPEQRGDYYTARDARITIAEATKAKSFEAQLHAALTATAGGLLDRDWLDEHGAPRRIERCLIDANWGKSRPVVYDWMRSAAHRSIVMPSHGRYIGAKSRPFATFATRPGDRHGLNWRSSLSTEFKGVRFISYDANFWKTAIADRLARDHKAPGEISLFAHARQHGHRLFLDHMTAEYRHPETHQGRTVDEWRLRPGLSENHWFDGLAGAAVAASTLGATPLTQIAAPPAKPRKRKRVDYL